MRSSLLLFFSLWLLSGFSQVQSQTKTAAPDSVDYYDLSLEQLLSVKAHGVPSELEALINSLISVASKKALTSRESPSIVSLITEEEIKKSGARDLIDVLRLVPGLNFATDVQGVVGIGSRGNWAHEGKILMLIDGQQMNEILYASLQFGNHYPLENIKRIEIIRGPGSAIYGGFAEFGVINIITKNGADMNGISASGTYGQMEKALGRTNINLSAGKQIKDLNISISGFAGHANRSDQLLTDGSGASYNMTGNSNLDPKSLNVGLSYKNLGFRSIYDNYSTTARDGYGSNLSKALPNNFKSYYAELKYDLKAGQKFTITPKLNYSRQAPWNFKGPTPDSSYTPYDRIASRYKANLTLSYKPTRKTDLLMGGEFYRDKGESFEETGTFYNGTKTVIQDNYAIFAEGVFRHRIVNVILGARYDKLTHYSDAFSPRIGLTKKRNAFHFKALYSNAFRAPAIENFSYTGDVSIRPEKTAVIEFELGYQLSKKMILTANLFDITTKDPIIYYGISETQQGYVNFAKTGTQGVEIEYRIKDTWGYIITNYSFYSAKNKERPIAYAVPDHREYMLGFSPHRINLNSSFNITKKLSLNPSFSFIGNRYGYTSADSLGNPLLSKIEPVILANIFFRYEDLGIKGLGIGLGMYDIFNEKPTFIQPYNSSHVPLPGPSREFVIKLEYNFNFKEKAK